MVNEPQMSGPFVRAAEGLQRRATQGCGVFCAMCGRRSSQQM